MFARHFLIMVPVVLMLPVWGAVVGSRRWRSLTPRGRFAAFAAWATFTLLLSLLVLQFRLR